MVWLLGMAWLLVRWCYGLRLMAALRREAQPLDSDAMAEVLGPVRQVLGTGPLPPMATSAGLDRPVMVGLVRPLVILPENVLRTLPEPELADILVHECAHAVCRHQVVGLLQRLAGTLFWPHPLVHLLNRELARARRRSAITTCCAAATRPAMRGPCWNCPSCLWAYPRNPRRSACFHCHWRLEDRVADLLDRRRKAMIRVSRWTRRGLDRHVSVARGRDRRHESRTSRAGCQAGKRRPARKPARKLRIDRKINPIKKSPLRAYFMKGVAAGFLPLLTTEIVRKELQLTETQREKTALLQKEWQESLEKIYKECPEEEQAKRRDEVHAETTKKLEATLEPRQIDRFWKSWHSWRARCSYRTKKSAKSLN